MGKLILPTSFKCKQLKWASLHLMRWETDPRFGFIIKKCIQPAPRTTQSILCLWHYYRIQYWCSYFLDYNILPTLKVLLLFESYRTFYGFLLLRLVGEKRRKNQRVGKLLSLLDSSGHTVAIKHYKNENCYLKVGILINNYHIM